MGFDTIEINLVIFNIVHYLLFYEFRGFSIAITLLFFLVLNKEMIINL